MDLFVRHGLSRVAPRRVFRGTPFGLSSIASPGRPSHEKKNRDRETRKCGAVHKRGASEKELRKDMKVMNDDDDEGFLGVLVTIACENRGRSDVAGREKKKKGAKGPGKDSVSVDERFQGK